MAITAKAIDVNAIFVDVSVSAVIIICTFAIAVLSVLYIFIHLLVSDSRSITH